MYFILEYALLFLVSYCLVITYASPTVSIHIKFWSVLTWTLNFAIALLVPEDIYLTLLSESNEQRKEWVGLQYQVLYWTVYLLTWTVIPVLQEWENSGDLESQDRLKRSFKSNGVFYLYMLVGGVVLLYLLWYFEVAGEMGLLTYLKCLATCWGIFLLMLMMGYALVEIPRSLWLTGSHLDYLRYCYRKIEEVEDELEDVHYEFKKITSFVLAFRDRTDDSKVLKYCEASLELIPDNFK